MSQTRNFAIADIDTQIQQAAAIQAANAGVRTTSQYPTERLFEPEPSTLRLVQPNPYVDVPLLPLAPGETPPPPPNAARDAQRQAERQQRTNGDQTRQILSGVRGGLQLVNLALRERGRQLNRRLGGMPTPGDVWTPFFILLALFLLIIPVNGHTRLMWLWLVLLGGAHVSTPFMSQQQVFEGAGGSTSGTSTVSGPITINPGGSTNIGGIIASGGNSGSTNLGGGITGTITSGTSNLPSTGTNGSGIGSSPILPLRSTLNIGYMSMINANVGETA